MNTQWCHQSQNIIVLIILERLEFEKFSFRPTMVADNTFQCSIPIPHTLKSILKSLFLKKLECHFLVESNKIENASFSYKTAISEANVKNWMGSTKWTYHKKRSFASNFLIFLIYQLP